MSDADGVNLPRSTSFDEPLPEPVAVVSTSLDSADLLARLARHLTQIFAVTSAYICDWNPETGTTTVLAEYFSAEACEEERVTTVGCSYNLYHDVARDPEQFETLYPLLLQMDDPTLAAWDRAHMKQFGGQTVLIVPLKTQNKIIGFAELWESRYCRDFSQMDIEHCQAIAQQAAIALVNARLYEAESRRRREAETLLEIAGYLCSTLELPEVLARTLDAVRRYLANISSCSVSIIDKDGRTLRTHAQWCAKPEYSLAPFGEAVPVEETLFTRRAMKNRQPITIADLWQVSFLNERARYFKKRGLRALLYVPLILRDKPIGVLHIHAWHAPRYFTPEEITLCQSVAHQAAIAVENANLYTGQHHQLKLAQMLQKVGALLTTSLPLNQVYGHIFDYLAEIIEYDFVSLHLEDKRTGRLGVVASRGFQNADKLHDFLAAYADTWLKRIPTPPGWAFVGNTRHDPGWSVLPSLEEISSWIGAVLMVKDQLIGILSLGSKQPGKYNAETAATAAAFANQAAVAIANARLHDQVVQQADELAILHQVAIATASIFDADELLHRTARMMTIRLYPHVFGFIMRDEHTGTLWPHASFHGIPQTYLNQPLPPESLIGLVAQTKEPRIVADITKEPLYGVGIPVVGMLSAIMVPITLKDTVMGVINVESPHLNAFSEKDLNFLMTLAGKVAAIIERTKLYQSLVAQKELLASQVAQRTAELQIERDRTMAILESAGEGVVLTNTHADILYVNRAMEDMSGYKRQEMVGKNFRFLSTHRIVQAVFDGLWTSHDSLERWSGELSNQRKDGSTYNVRLMVTPIQDTAGTTTGYVIMQSDISQVKEVERLKAEFIANVTHDLRTPLTNIKTYVSLLQRGKPENHPRYFSVLHQEADRLNLLIQDLLDISRLDAEFTPDPAASTDLTAVLADLEGYFSGSLQERDIRLVVTLPEARIPAIHMGKAHLRKALENLLDNAIKYSPRGGIVRVVVHVPAPPRKDFIEVEISDEGPGVTDAELPRLFERFFRGEAARRGNVPGTGLGLSVARKIVERYGGLVDVTHRKGEGLYFFLWLPLLEDE